MEIWKKTTMKNNKIKYKNKKCYKSRGEDNVKAELIKYEGEQLEL